MVRGCAVGYGQCVSERKDKVDGTGGALRKVQWTAVVVVVVLK